MIIKNALLRVRGPPDAARGPSRVQLNEANVDDRVKGNRKLCVGSFSD